MNPIITNLIQELETYGHSVINKTYVLKRLRESQKLDCPNCKAIPIYEMSSLRMDNTNPESG